MTVQRWPGIADTRLTATPSQQRESYKGMAHFAGTSLVRGARCGDCAYARKAGHSQGQPLIQCAQYAALTRDKVARKFPPHAWACKYYQSKSARKS